MVVPCILVNLYFFKFLLGVTSGWDALTIIAVIKDLALGHFQMLLRMLIIVREKLFEFMLVEEDLDKQFSMEIL